MIKANRPIQFYSILYVYTYFSQVFYKYEHYILYYYVNSILIIKSVYFFLLNGRKFMWRHEKQFKAHKLFWA